MGKNKIKKNHDINMKINTNRYSFLNTKSTIIERDEKIRHIFYSRKKKKKILPIDT